MRRSRLHFAFTATQFLHAWYCDLFQYQYACDRVWSEYICTVQLGAPLTESYSGTLPICPLGWYCL
jgi:hypothetical protein